MSHVTCRMSHVACLMSNAYVDPWDMLNNFCFHVYAQILLCMGEKCNAYFLTAAAAAVFVIMSHVRCHISHVTCQMSYVKCLCWSLGHSEQLLFSCLYSKVSICDYVTFRMSHVICQMLISINVDSWDMLNNFCFDDYAQKWVFVIMSHVACHMSHVTCLMSNAYIDPWDMLNNFCFHVYAQMSLFMGENVNDFFTSTSLDPGIREVIELVPSWKYARLEPSND